MGLAMALEGSATLFAFDQGVTAAIQALRGPVMTVVMRVFSAMGSTLFVALAAVGITAWLWLSGDRVMAVYAGVVIAVGGLLSDLSKLVFLRERPDQLTALISLPGSFSFPSGHTMGSFCLAFVLAYVVHRRGWSAGRQVLAIAALAVYAFMVGVSRVYLGVHWPSDVVASWALGGAWVGLSLVVMRFVRG